MVKILCPKARKLLNLNPNKSTGISNIQTKFLKDGAHEIKGVIMHINNVSIFKNHYYGKNIVPKSKKNPSSN